MMVMMIVPGMVVRMMMVCDVLRIIIMCISWCGVQGGVHQ